MTAGAAQWSFVSLMIVFTDLIVSHGFLVLLCASFSSLFWENEVEENQGLLIEPWLTRHRNIMCPQLDLNSRHQWWKTVALKRTHPWKPMLTLWFNASTVHNKTANNNSLPFLLFDSHLEKLFLNWLIKNFHKQWGESETFRRRL